MKNLISLKYTVICFFALLIAGCELGLQENFEFDPGEIATDPFVDMTAWEFIQTRDIKTVNAAGDSVLNVEELNYMIAAIKRAGFEDLYNGSNRDRTYIILTNGAFTGANGIIRIITGAAAVQPGETPDEVMARANVDIIRNILRYHIVDAYIDQVPTLFLAGQWYIYQTLIEGDDGRIGFLRDERHNISINAQNPNANPLFPPAPLPSTATSRFIGVRNHNYVFKNGIGHMINAYVQNRPYN